MIKLMLEGLRGEDGNVLSVEVDAPAVPQKGDYVSHEASGIAGYVRNVDYWWEENANKLTITVMLK